MGRRLKGRFCLPLMLCFAAIVWSVAAGAKPEFLDAAKTAYTFKPGGAIDGKSCNLCHAGSTNRNSLNFYGRDVKGALDSSADHQLTPALLHTLDSHDSDGDGWRNSEEFNADTLPGDPASKPSGPAPGSLKPNASALSGAESNPFSFKSLFFPSHAQHPIIVHFPIALFVFSFFLDIFGIRTGNRNLNAAAYYNLIAAAITGVISVVTGLIAWKFARGGVPLTQDKWLMFHLILGVLTTILIAILWGLRAKTSRDPMGLPGRTYIILALITMAVISLTGHLGGVVSGIVS